MAAVLKSGVAAVVLMLASVAGAQESENRVDVTEKWNVFAEPPANPSECWGVAIPMETVNTDSSGRIKAVKRGDILLFVTFRTDGTAGEVSFTGGYPFAENSFVKLTIGDTEFEMLTEGEWAWPMPDINEDELLAAMKRGASALLTGRSSRGTVTKDTFSLFGFTAAMDSAENFCKG